MSHRPPKTMSRQFRKKKPLIFVFCEGESEQAYTQFLKEQFEDAAVIRYPRHPGLFSFALDKFSKDARYRNNAEVTDEIWFFFDVEKNDRDKLEKRWRIIRALRKIRKRPNVRIRLLMTTACIEYWFLLHYKQTAPTPLESVEDKEQIRRRLVEIVPEYQKGDETSIRKIAADYPNAVNHGKWTLDALQRDGLPTLEDTDDRNYWLCRCGKTFTTVHEAILFLESLDNSI